MVHILGFETQKEAVARIRREKDPPSPDLSRDRPRKKLPTAHLPSLPTVRGEAYNPRCGQE
jgi:hypothetical protein